MFYVFIFIALLLTGVGLFPIPEDIIVLSAGIGVQQEVGNSIAAFFVILIGIIISDAVIFWIGKNIGRKVFKMKFFSFFLPQDKVERVHKIFGDHNKKIVFIGRFTSGFRPVILFTAGMSDSRFSDFLIYDIAASILYIPLLMFLGYRFSYDIISFFEDTRRIYHIIEVAIISAIVIWFVFRLSKKIFNNNGKKNN
ncbi:MAG: DedA family protein [Candidatus Paceibacterota bacterium]